MQPGRSSLLTAVACLTALVVPSLLSAQAAATTGVVRGVVTNQAGDPVVGAVVELRETNTNFLRRLTTLSNGRFVANLLPLGTYEITTRSPGLQESRQSGIIVRVGDMVDLQIELGAIVRLDAIVVEVDPAVNEASRSEAATRLPGEAVTGLPNNGRNFLDLTTLTPNVAIVQGPDGDELSIAGQRGIHNNVSVDGADFNNPFFGEQRGGQRPPFTFNLDAVQDLVVTNGANAEFGRSGGGFVNVITKSGTNELSGTVHYFGKFDALSAAARHTNPDGSLLRRDPDFSQHQFGFTLGGPIVRDKAFFFFAYDQQVLDDTRQQDPNRISGSAGGAAADAALADFIQNGFGGALAGDDGPIERSDNARAFLSKFDFRLGENHNLSLKYNYTWSQQENGTFDVDQWLRSANATEKDFSHAVNGSLQSILGDRVTNEFRFQYSREDRPRPYAGPTIPGTTPAPGVSSSSGPGRPFPDIAFDFAGEFRLGMPFFIPVEYHDTRVQLLDNVTFTAGDHLIKVGAEYNRVESVQTFIGFANGRYIFTSTEGFLNFVENGGTYVECSDGSSSNVGTCPAGETIVGPVALFLQQAGVGGTTAEQAGTQAIPQTELAFFIQDSWKPHPNLTLNYGIRWEGSFQPDVITPANQVFFSPLIGTSVTTTTGQTVAFPSNGEIPDDLNNWQPRFGFAWDAKGDAKTILRGSAGWYFSRIPGLNLASTRSTNGSIGQTIFRDSGFNAFGAPPPDIDEQLPDPTGAPFGPDVFVFSEDFENPRTFTATLGFETEVTEGLSATLDLTHSRTDNLTRFTDRNAGDFGDNPAGCAAAFLNGPFCGFDTDGDGAIDNGIGALTTVESTARSRYYGITVGLERNLDPVAFQINYTLAWDKSDDDNERDPFTLRYFTALNFENEYNWSDRDQRHRLNAWLLARLPQDFILNNRLTATTAQPGTETCGAGNTGTGTRAFSLQDPGRVCPDGSVLKRNTLRKDNGFFSWDVRLSKVFPAGGTNSVELIFEVFNVTNADNFIDPSFGGLLFNFDGTVQSGLGSPRQAQVGVKWAF